MAELSTNQEDEINTSVALQHDLELEKLRTEVASLHEKLKKNTEIHTITQLKEVEPHDYEDLKKQNKRLKNIVRKYQQAYAIGGISTLNLLVDDYKSFSKKRLAEITNEILSQNYDRETIIEVAGLCDYLAGIRSSFKALLKTYTNGKWVNNPAFRKIKNDVDNITTMLGKETILMNLDESKYEEYHQLLCRIADSCTEFLEKNSGKKGMCS